MNRAHNEFISELHEKYAEQMIQLTYRRIGDKELAKDLVQEAFLTACFKVETLHEHKNPAGWLFKTVSYLTTREMGKFYHSKEVPINGDIASEDSEFIPLEFILPNELSKDERQIICWRLIDDISYKEIAEMEGITEAASRKRFSRAIQNCKEYLHLESDKLSVTKEQSQQIY